ncbi:MAG: hypothetical protein IPI04_15860 [Ignavibacteria bacterium]|nr:hypothetical protein [Ignavibacteria bacterium]
MIGANRTGTASTNAEGCRPMIMKGQAIYFPQVSDICEEDQINDFH